MEQLRILFVDDDADLRHIVKDQLAPQEFVMDEAEDGAKAIAMLEKGNYALMLLDINMPVKSGIDVLKLDAKHRVGQRFDHGPFYFDRIFFRHCLKSLIAC